MELTFQSYFGNPAIQLLGLDLYEMSKSCSKIMSRVGNHLDIDNCKLFFTTINEQFIYLIQIKYLNDF